MTSTTGTTISAHDPGLARGDGFGRDDPGRRGPPDRGPREEHGGDRDDPVRARRQVEGLAPVSNRNQNSTAHAPSTTAPARRPGLQRRPGRGSRPGAAPARGDGVAHPDSHPAPTSCPRTWPRAATITTVARTLGGRSPAYSAHELQVDHRPEHEEREQRRRPELHERRRHERVGLGAERQRGRERHHREDAEHLTFGEPGQQRRRGGTSGSTAAIVAPSSRYRPMNRKSLPRCTKNRRHRASGRPSSSRCSWRLLGVRLEQFVLRAVADDPPDRDRDEHPEEEAAADHRPQRRPAPERDERRGDDDGVQHRRGEHERDGRRRHEPPLREPARDRHRPALADREREPGERGRGQLQRPREVRRASRACRSARTPRRARRRAHRAGRTAAPGSAATRR